MNRLWVRLSLAFGALFLMGPFLMALTGFFISQTQVFRFLVRTELLRPGGLVDELEAHYELYGSWRGVKMLLIAYDNIVPRGPDLERVGLILVNLNQSVIYQSPAISEDYPPPDNNDIIPINVAGQTRGYLQIVNLPFTDIPAALRPEFRAVIIRQVSQILVVLAGISAVVGISMGVMMSRSLTAPITHLVQTVQAFGQRDFAPRAAVKGSLELRQLAQSFNEMADNIAHAETLRRNLMADVAHELRTPLSVLQANLIALQDGVYPLEQREITKLLSQTALLTRLVQELHELAQAEARQLPLHLQQVNVVELIRAILDKFDPMAQQHNIHLTMNTPAEVIWWWGDEDRLAQVLHNLLQNALTYTPPQGSIIVQLQPYDKELELTISDSGQGIALEHLPHIFDRFYRIEHSRSRESGGAGLGLAIVKAIVELHGGTIHVSSELGQGTRFQIRLPLTF